MKTTAKILAAIATLALASCAGSFVDRNGNVYDFSVAPRPVKATK